MKRFWGFIKDPLYGYIRINEREKKVIDSYPMQRLRRIKQLSGSEFVYPAANHTRFEHSLGTMYLAGIMGENIPAELSEHDLQMLRYAGLLHDVGHGPFSHIFDSFLSKVMNKTHEDMTITIIENTKINDILDKEGFDTKKISKLSVGLLHDIDKAYINQIIVGTFDVDKMDYVSRDSYHTGAGYGYIDIFRLIYTMAIHNKQLVINMNAIPTLETFLIARLESFKTIYFHKASRAVQIMLVKAIEQSKDELPCLNFRNVDEYLILDDYTLWNELKKCEKSYSIISDIEQRNLLKCAYEKTLYTKEHLMTSLFSNDTFRKNIEKEIAERASINTHEVIIDTPSLPSVPYSRENAGLMDIPISFSQPNKAKQIRRVTELSRIIEVLRVYLNIVRVYTKEEYRNKIKKAAEEIFSTLPSETKMAY